MSGTVGSYISVNERQSFSSLLRMLSKVKREFERDWPASRIASGGKVVWKQRISAFSNVCVDIVMATKYNPLDYLI